MRKYLALLFMLTASQCIASETAISPVASLIKTISGLVVVLIVMGFIAWAVKKLGPNRPGMHSVARIVGGVNVGTREKVMVIEIADRWIVVGVASGSVSALANLSKGAGYGDESLSTNVPATELTQIMASTGQSFANWLKHSLSKRN